MRYNYCPVCGTKLTTIEAGDDGPMPYCKPCDKVWFDAFDSCVAVLTCNEFNEIVLQWEERVSSVYAGFTYGHIKPGETPEQAAVREVKEEIGQDIDDTVYVGSFWSRDGNTLLHCFLGFARKKPISTSPEILRAEWVPIPEAPKSMYPESPWNTMYPLYRKLVSMLGLPDYTKN